MIKVGIVGGTGYTGVELLRLLAQHPEVKLEVITSRAESGVPVAQIFPSLRGYLDALCFTAPDPTRLAECDVVFFATPHGVAMCEAPALLAQGVKVIDLSADFRLKNAEIFKQWYGMQHTCPELLPEAIYGLVEINRSQIATARLIAVPGCYPTAVQLGFAPLLAAIKAGNNLADTTRLIADVKSGVSGAGRKAEIATLLVEAADNFKAYSVQGHRHHPEIIQGLQTMVGQSNPLNLTFIPHLVPMIRGIHATLYIPINPDFHNYNFQLLFEQFYEKEYFVDILPFASMPETRSVRASNRVRIAICQPNLATLVVLVVEDNLVKGASGQAIQCMNLMCGLAENTGLTQIAIAP